MGLVLVGVVVVLVRERGRKGKVLEHLVVSPI